MINASILLLYFPILYSLIPNKKQMKPKLLFEELSKIIIDSGIKIRKDILKSKGGYCIIDDNKLIILNKMLPVETHCKILARCI